MSSHTFHKFLDEHRIGLKLQTTCKVVLEVNTNGLGKKALNFHVHSVRMVCVYTLQVVSENTFKNENTNSVDCSLHEKNID